MIGDVLDWVDILFLLFPVILVYGYASYIHSTIDYDDENIFRVHPTVSFILGNLRKDGRLSIYGLMIQFFISWFTPMYALNTIGLAKLTDIYIGLAGQTLMVVLLQTWLYWKKIKK